MCFCVCICVRIAVFSVTVFYDERVVIVAEQRPDASEEDSFQWMSRVLQVHLTHQVLYSTHLQNSNFGFLVINQVIFVGCFFFFVCFFIITLLNAFPP